MRRPTTRRCDSESMFRNLQRFRQLLFLSCARPWHELSMNFSKRDFKPYSCFMFYVYISVLKTSLFLSCARPSLELGMNFEMFKKLICWSWAGLQISLNKSMLGSKIAKAQHPRIVAGCMGGLNDPFPAPGADDVYRQFSLGPPSFLPEEAPWKKDPRISNFECLKKQPYSWAGHTL